MSSKFLPIIICFKCRGVIAQWSNKSKISIDGQIYHNSWQFIFNNKFMPDSNATNVNITEIQNVYGHCCPCCGGILKPLKAHGKCIAFNFFNPYTWLAFFGDYWIIKDIYINNSGEIIH